MKTALIAGIVAAVVAAASSTAATLVVTSKTIKDGTIQTVDLSAAAKRALKGNRGARGAAGAPGQTGAQGLQGIQGPPGPAGIQRIKFIVSNPANMSPGQTGTAEASCPAGETAVSGGFALVGADAGVTQSVNLGSKWVAKAENAAAPAENATLTAYAYCSPGVTFVP